MQVATTTQLHNRQDKKVTATMKIYPAVITSKKDEFWIETQGAKKVSVKFDRNKISDKEFKNIFEYMLSLGYAAHTRDTFMKQVPAEDLYIEQKILNEMFDLVLV